MAEKTQSTNTSDMKEKQRARIKSGKGTELPYGFGLEELKKGLKALAYADGSANGFHNALNLKPPIMYYVSKALRTIGLLNENFERSPKGNEFVDSPSSHKTILTELILNYKPYIRIIKTCAVDSSLKNEAELNWVAQKLASEIKTSQKPKQIARQAATSFGAFISVAGLGSMTGGKSGTIKWKITPDQIIKGSKVLSITNSESSIDETPSSSSPSLAMNIMQPDVHPTQHQSSTAPTYKKRQAVFSQEEINGGFSIGSSYLATAADMTNWTEAQIKFYWDGHNHGLELLLELIKLKVKS